MTICVQTSLDVALQKIEHKIIFYMQPKLAKMCKNNILLHLVKSNLGIFIDFLNKDLANSFQCKPLNFFCHKILALAIIKTMTVHIERV
jgi:hypothetical protein